MKKLLATVFLVCVGCCGSVNGDEGWGRMFIGLQ
jgi:hypothetical protein